MLVRPLSALIPQRHLKAGRVQAAEWCRSREWREKPSLLASVWRWVPVPFRLGVADGGGQVGAWLGYTGG